MRSDILIRNGHIIDPASNLDSIADIALAGGKVVQVAENIDPSGAAEIIDARGLLVTPGIIDAHVHLVAGGSDAVPYNMLLRRGVTTAMDMMGDIGTFVSEMKESGHGLNAACLHALVIGKDVKTNNADRAEIGSAIDAVLEKGAFGIKIMGGHFPFTPETTALIIAECARRGVYVAFHAGTTVNGSNIKGFEEAVALSAGNPLHIAHTNAYCRGQVEDVLLETHRLLTSLEKNPHITSESYISVMNGTSAEVKNGIVHSAVTRTWLEKRGYATDRAGMGKAVKEGWALIYGRIGGEFAYLPPAEGFAYWDGRDTDAWCSFPVNNPVAMLACATARRKDGSFTVDAISTDGGAIPRNVIFENGIRLVQMRYMTLSDMVRKSSLLPARMLGLTSKGHLTPGADADVAIFDPQNGQARYTIASGKVRMAAGICGTGGGVVISSAPGAEFLEKSGTPYIVPDMTHSTFRQGHP